MIKKTLALIACLITLSAAAQTKEEIKWYSFNEAAELCKSEPKYIMIDVYTDWCGWCKRMDQSTFQDSAVVRYMNDHFYAVKLNAEGNEKITFNGMEFVNPGTGNRSVHQFAAALLQGKMSYPSYVFMNPKMQLLTTVPGYSTAENFLPILDFFASESYLIMNWEEYRSATKQQ